MTNWPHNLATFSFGLFSLFTTRTVPCKLYFQQLRHCSLSDTVYRSSARCIDCRSGWIGLASLSYHHRAFGGLLELLLVISYTSYACVYHLSIKCLSRFDIVCCKLWVLVFEIGANCDASALSDRHPRYHAPMKQIKFLNIL